MWDLQSFLAGPWEESWLSDRAGRASGFGEGRGDCCIKERSPGSRSRPLPLPVPLGTWMMTGNGVMHNGTTILDEYGHNLDRLKVGARVPLGLGEQGWARRGGLGPALTGTLPDSSLQPPFLQGRGHGGRGAAGGRDPALLRQRDDSGPCGLERAPGRLRCR